MARMTYEDKALRLGILGGGRAAWAFGSALQRAGWPISGVWLRDESSSRLPSLLEVRRAELDVLAAESDLLLIAVSDRAISEVAARVPDTDAVVFHASGALPAVRGGFSLHPLKSLPPVGDPSPLDNVLLVFEGAHETVARRVANAVGGRMAAIDVGSKMLYHAAAVFGSNYVAAMLDIAERLMESAGISNAKEDLVRLAASAAANWRAHDDARRFTGPAIRGDREVIERHRDALRERPEVEQLYALLAEVIGGANLASREERVLGSTTRRNSVER
jgi:predicted short-subunit dehydrogenase-like oxidoreductase (DUF2520 family)